MEIRSVVSSSDDSDSDDWKFGMKSGRQPTATAASFLLPFPHGEVPKLEALL